ncbi:MAG: exopolyphosphatase [Methylococcales bacterium]|nr:exopolyphosphatase [Methylococcales bacterium]
MIKALPETVAAIDLGSNSFHMIVCRVKDGKLHTIDRLKEMVRLASGLNSQGQLTGDAQERALACLERFGQRVRGFPPGSVRVVGTNTLRNALNAADFIRKAEQVLGHPVDIIAGVEEARLIYQGVVHSIASSAPSRLVMDIGGGSTEYIIGQGDSPKRKESLEMGCVSVSKAYFPRGEYSAKAMHQAVLFAQQQLEPYQRIFHVDAFEEAIGASGSLRAIDRVLTASGWSHGGITPEALEALLAAMSRCQHSEEFALSGLDPERVPVFAGGVAIVQATFQSLGIRHMTVADGALREGLVYDLLGRLYDHDIRAETVAMLCERYHTDQAHAARIKQTLQALLAQVSLTTLTENQLESMRQYLDWAADLHELGQDIAHSQYHKHSAYILAHADLAGFSRQDQLLLEALVRSHRKKFSLSRFAALPEPWREWAPLMAILLRLACLLHRSRQDAAPPTCQLSWKPWKHKLKLGFPDQWLANAPLTQADLDTERDYLEKAGYRFEYR